MIYTGIFVPTVVHYLIVEMGVEVRVDRPAFERIGIGDTVWVSRYTNGSYRLEA